jgi:hypothetical protein
MVQVIANEIVDVVAVRYLLMTAVPAVGVSGVVAITGMLGRALLGMRRIDLHDVLVHVIAVRVMEMTVVQVVHMARVLDGGVTATRSVLVGVIRMNSVLVHANSLPRVHGD